MIKPEHTSKFNDFWEPRDPEKDIPLRKRLMVSEVPEGRNHTNIKVLPQIEIKLIKGKLASQVRFSYFDPAYSDPEDRSAPEYIYNMVGPVDEVYRGALKVSSKIGIGYERNFNREWNKTLLAVVNRPSEGKSMLNLGTYQPKDKFGLYDLKTPAQLLSRKLIASKIPGATFAARAGVDEATLYRHLSGTAISREASVKYAKVLGCDPAELNFNPLLVPIWARADTQEMKSINKLSVYAGELRPNTKDEYALCPREIYRPDVKCVVVDQPNSVYHKNNFFYYHSTEKQDLENQLVVAGTPIKNFNDKELRYRYFLGIYKASALGKGVFNIVSIDPHLDYGTPDAEDNPKEYADYLVDIIENNYVIDNVKPTDSTFVAPIVSIVNPARIAKSELRSEIIKDHDKFYGQARMSDQMNILKYKELLHLEKLKAQVKTEKEKTQLLKKNAEIQIQSQKINNELQDLFKKFEQQQQMAHQQAMETRSKGGNALQKIFHKAWTTGLPMTDTGSDDKLKQNKYEQDLKEAIMEQQKAVEKLKEAVSVPELTEQIPYVDMDDEDKVA